MEYILFIRLMDNKKAFFISYTMRTRKKRKNFLQTYKNHSDNIGKQVANKPFYAKNSLANHISNEVRIQSMTMSETSADMMLYTRFIKIIEN